MLKTFAELFARRSVVACIIPALLLLTLPAAGLWWTIPPEPRLSWKTGLKEFPEIYLSDKGDLLLTITSAQATVWRLESGEKWACCHKPNPSSWPQTWTWMDGDAILWRGGHRTYVWNWMVDQKPITVTGQSVQISPTLATSSRSDENQVETFSFWNLRTGIEMPAPPWKEPLDRRKKLTNGDWLGVEVGAGETLTVWDLRTQTKRRTFTGATSPTDISPDGRLLAASAGTEVKIWEMPNGKTITSISKGVKIWDLASGRERHQLTRPELNPYNWGVWNLSSDGNRLEVYCWRRIKDSVVGSKCLVCDLTFNPPREFLFEDHEDGRFLETHFSPDCQWVAQRRDRNTQTGIGRKWEWTVRNLDGSRTLDLSQNGFAPRNAGGPVGDIFTPLTFSPDSKTVAGVTFEDYAPGFVRKHLDRISKREVPDKIVVQVCVWELSTGKRVGAIDNGVRFAYFPDGKSLAAYLKDGTIEIWDVPARRPLWVDYGLPALVALLIFLGISYWRWVRRAPLRTS